MLKGAGGMGLRSKKMTILRLSDKEKQFSSSFL